MKHHSIAPMPTSSSTTSKNSPVRSKSSVTSPSLLSPKTKTEEKVFARELVEIQGVSGSFECPDIPPEPLLVSERFNEISRGHLEAQVPSERRKEHFNLVLKSDMRCDSSLHHSSSDVLTADKYTIDPRGKSWVAYFDQAIAVSLIYTAFVTPYELGFLNNQKQAIDALFIMGNLINLVFMVDFVLNFFLQTQRNTENGGSYEGNHKTIIMQYVRGPCVVDFASSVPWDAVEMTTGANSGLSGLRLLRLLRLLKLLRIIRGSRLIEKYKAEFQFSFAHVTLGLYVVTIMLFAHWVACLWGYAATSRRGGNTWMVSEDIEDDGPFTQYTVALYFATMTITTVGYGDVTPQNRDEYILVTIVMIAGGFLWAYVIGGICSLVATMNFDKRRFQQDFDRVNNMLGDLGMPNSFCTYVRRYMFNAEPMLRRNTYNELILLLTPHQQREIAVHRSRANLVQVPYLRDCSPESVLKVYSALRQMVYAPQEMLDLPHTLFIIVNNGIVVKGGQIFSLGSCLAVDFILESESLMDKSVGTALTFVQVETLHHKTLFKVLESFPNDRAVVRRAKIRLALMRKVVGLAKIELDHRREVGEDLKEFRRWSMHSNDQGMARSLSNIPDSNTSVNKPSDKKGMYALAPRSQSVQEERGTSLSLSLGPSSPQFQGRVPHIVHHSSMKEVDIKTHGPRKSFIGGLSTERQTAKGNFASSSPLSRERSKSFDRALGDSGSVVLGDIKAQVKLMEEKTDRIESAMLQVTATLASLTSAIEANRKNKKSDEEKNDVNDENNENDFENENDFDFSESTLTTLVGVQPKKSNSEK